MKTTLHPIRLTAACLLALSLVAMTSHAQSEPSPSGSAYVLADQAYKAYARGDYAAAVGNARQAVHLAPANPDYRLLLVNALFAAGLYDQAEAAATSALEAGGENATLLAQRGLIRLRLGKEALARQDFDQALRIGNLTVATEIGLLVELDRHSEARRRFEQALAGGDFAKISDVEVAYLAIRVGDDDNAFAAFNRADAAGKLAGSAYQDAAFAAVRTNNDAQAVAYFKRSIDEVNPIKLHMTQQLFETRRAVAEVARQTGVIASLSYRGPVSGRGPAGNAGANTLQVGVEGYWRPWGYRNGRYVELFARAFETLHNKDGKTGYDTLQAAVGVRHKPLREVNLVVSFSRVFSPGGHDDWLAQLGYSGGSGTDLRVDVPAWWTIRFSAEAGRYLSARQNYALANAEAGRSVRMGDAGGKWVLFPHLSVAADYDSTAIRQSSVGIGPGISMRYWFREDVYNAPRSYLDLFLQYRVKIGGAQRAEGTFATATLSY